MNGFAVKKGTAGNPIAPDRPRLKIERNGSVDGARHDSSIARLAERWRDIEGVAELRRAFGNRC